MENVKKTAGPIAAKRQQQLEHEQEKQQKKHGHQSSALENGSGATGANGGSNGSGGGGGGGSGGGGATMLGDGRKSQKALDKKQKELSKIEKIFAKGKKTREDVARKRELREEVKRIYGRQLTQAAGAGDLALVEEILQRDRRMVNATDDSRQTALHAAASGGHVNVVRYLLRCKADCYLQDERGWTALHCAAFENRDDVMEELCKQRHIDFSATNEDENTPLHYFARSPPSSAKPRILCLLLAGGADINARNTLQETPLHMAIWKQNAAMAALLIEHGANAKIPNNKGDTPYDWLYILNNKALTDEVDAAIRTYEARRHRIPVTSPIPVVAAAASSSSSLSLSSTTTSSSLPSSSSSSSSSWTLGKISRKLHSLSPSPSDRGVVRQPLHPRSSSLLPPQPQPHQLQHTQKNNNNSSGSGNGVGSNGSGSSVREEDSLSSRERLKEEIFMDAVRSGKIEEVKGLLKLDRRLADCSTGPSKNTPLHVAALLGNLAVVKLLLGAATKVPKNTAGWTPLMAALWRGHEAAALSILLSPLHLDVAAKLDDGNTALHLAARNAGPLIEFVLDALLDRGAAIDAPNARGDTPLHCAARGNQADLVKMLVAKGANKGRANKAGETALTIAQKNLFGQVVAVLS